MWWTRSTRGRAVATGVLAVVMLSPIPTAAADQAPAAAFPSVAITSPEADSLVRDVVTVTVVGHVDPAGTQRPGVISLVPQHQPGDSRPPKDADCATADTDADPATCTVSFTWSTLSLQDPEKFEAGFSSGSGPDATFVSTTLRLRIFHQTRVSFSKRHTLAAGTRFYVAGVVSVNGTTSASYVRVVVRYVPTVGHQQTVVANADAGGRFRVRFTAVAGGTLIARSLPTAEYGGSESRVTVGATAQVSCTMTRTLARGGIARGGCRIPYLRRGDRVALQAKVPYGWRNFVTGRSPTSGGVDFAVRFPYVGTFVLRLVMAGNDSFVQTRSRPMQVVVT